jgi:RNA polymerase sigma-70 factor (ECF subfamily)
MENFEKAYKENYPKLFCMARKMVNDGEVARDIVQEVFICYFEKWQKGLVLHHLPSWLMRVTINKCVDYLNQITKHTQLGNLSEWATEEEVSDSTSYVMLKQAIAKLKPVEMKLIMLYSEGYSYKEIAEIAELKFSSVGKTLSRTLHKLKETLKNMKYELY